MSRCSSLESFTIAALLALGCATSRYDGEPVEPLDAGDGGTSFLGLAALSPACGADAGAATCSPCLVTECSAEYSACLGPEFQSGSAGGACTELASCALGCACGDTACFQTCLSGAQADAECTTCLRGLTDCGDGACAVACAGDPNADGGSEGGGPEEAGSGGGSEAGAGAQRGAGSG